MLLLLYPDEKPILLLNELFLVVWGCPLKENNIGELLNSFGKLESFIKFSDILAIELDVDEGFEVGQLFLLLRVEE